MKQPEKILNGKKLTRETIIEGVGIVRSYGELDLEKLVKRLLTTKSIVN